MISTIFIRHQQSPCPLPCACGLMVEHLTLEVRTTRVRTPVAALFLGQIQPHKFELLVSFRPPRPAAAAVAQWSGTEPLARETTAEVVRGFNPTRGAFCKPCTNRVFYKEKKVRGPPTPSLTARPPASQILQHANFFKYFAIV